MTWFSWKEEQLLLDLRVQPRAKQDGIAGIAGGRLRVRIQSPPVDGKANKHLLEFLAKQFGVPRTRIVLVSGKSSRDKRIAIHAPFKQPDWFRELADRNQTG